MNYLLSICCVIVLISSDLAKADSPKLNILFLYADDLGYGDLSCLNAESKIQTPHLDDLAKQSMSFSDGHSSSGICTPSRYALLTGRHHWRDFHGIVKVFGSSVFKADRLTLPEMLQQNGYHTAAIGKWHLGWDWQSIRKPDAKAEKDGRNPVWGPEDYDWSKPIPDGPLAHGFNHYFGDTVINFPPYCWIEDDKVVDVPDTLMDTDKWKPIKEGNWECRPGPMITGWDPYENIPTTTQKAVEYIKTQGENKEQPFFLYFAFPSPHAPIIPNDEFDGKTQAGAYGDFVYETDHACGRILTALKESGQYENTIIFFSADNGSEKYAYQRDEKFDHWSSAPFRGLKRDIYEGGHRVPFMIKWPGVTEGEQRSDALVSQVDLMGTLAAYLDFELPAKAAEDSHNLLPLLKGEVEKVRDSHVHNTSPKAWAIRHGDWNLIQAKKGNQTPVGSGWAERHNYPKDDDLPVELYNLKEDIGQRNNLASEHPEKVEQLKALLSEIKKQGYSAPRLAK